MLIDYGNKVGLFTIYYQIQRDTTRHLSQLPVLLQSHVDVKDGVQNLLDIDDINNELKGDTPDGFPVDFSVLLYVIPEPEPEPEPEPNHQSLNLSLNLT